jgi:hypothetical protein
MLRAPLCFSETEGVGAKVGVTWLRGGCEGRNAGYTPVWGGRCCTCDEMVDGCVCEGG